MSDANNQTFEQLVAQIQALGIDPATPFEQLPPHVQEMLKAYVKPSPLDDPTSKAGKPFGYNDTAVLQGMWDRVNQQADRNVVDAATKKAQADGVVTPTEKQVIDRANKSGKLTPQDQATLNLPQTPKWLLQQLQSDPTSAQQQRIVKEWNTVFGTKMAWSQLVTSPQFNDATDMTKSVVNGALLDIDPIVSYAVTLPGNRKYDVTADQMKTQFGLYGYKTEDVSRIIRYADTFGFKDSTGNVAWQPLAALIKAHGIDLSAGDYVQDSSINSDTGKPNHVKVGYKMPDGTTVTNADLAGTIQPAYKGNQPAAKNELSIAELTMGYQQALKKYGDPTLAYLGSLDSGLASRLMATGGDSTKVSNEDALLAGQLMLNGQWSPAAQKALGYEGGSGLDAFMKHLTDVADAGKAAERTMPDPETIKQNVKDMWRSWFRSEPSDAMVNQMTGELRAAVSAAPKDQSVDLTARLRAMAEASPEYKTLYGHKQPGQSETDYQQQFVQGAQSLLGNEAPDNASVLAGMRTGSYQTTIGSTAASAQAMQNSTFLGHLAEAARIVNQNT